jgi:lipopolysaccharide export system permease protein
VLPRYIALRFARVVLGVFTVIFTLVMMVDYVESLRRASNLADVSMWTIAQISLFRVPQLTEQVLPFSVLIGAMTCYLALSRRLELVVARAAGVSAWQFVAPAVFVAFVIGIAATTIYNPLAAALRERSDRLQSEISGTAGSGLFQATTGFYVRQRSADGSSIINAVTSTDNGRALAGVTVFSYDPNGRFRERINASSARLEREHWALRDAHVFTAGAPPHDYETYLLPTNLTSAQVGGTFSKPDTVAFWQLPGHITMAERAGVSAAAYSFQYQLLLARPFLLVAMVLFGASVSLRPFRFGGIQRMILLGIAGGFVIYVALKVTEDLSRAALLHPIPAAWLPVLVGGLTGFVALLYQEDG